MVRTAEKTSRVTGGKAPRKHYHVNRPDQRRPSTSTTERSSLNPIQNQPIPKWQQPITDFFSRFPAADSENNENVENSSSSDSDEDDVKDIAIECEESDNPLAKNENSDANDSGVDQGNSVSNDNTETKPDTCENIEMDEDQQMEHATLPSDNDKENLDNPNVQENVPTSSSKKRTLDEEIAKARSCPKSPFDEPRYKKLRMNPEFFKHLEDMER